MIDYLVGFAVGFIAVTLLLRYVPRVTRAFTSFLDRLPL